MTKIGFPVGLEMDVTYPSFRVSLTLLSNTQLKFEIKEGPFARIETVDIDVVPLGNSIFAVSWQEQSGATVTNVQDYDRNVVLSFATLPDGQFMRMKGAMTIARAAAQPSDDRPLRNKALVLEAMTSLFQRRDTSAVERLYAQDYIQHNPNIPQGRDALQAIVAELPDHVYYEPGLVVAGGDLVAIHGRIRGWAEESLIAIDIFRIENGKLAEHWDVLQSEVAATTANSGTSMFDPEEATNALRRHS